MTTNAEPTPSTPERWEREDTWQSLAIAAAVMLILGFVVASFWVIVAPDDNARLLRVQISAPFGVFGGAVVTFCTIVWRGLISKRQADAQLKATNLQREQIDKLALQIAATEENNLADLLQQGAELIAEADKKAHVAAGIAILQSVVEAPNGKFATQAMDLLADFVQDSYSHGTPSDLASAAIAALEIGSTFERISNRVLRFDASGFHTTATPANWTLIYGVSRVSYEGGICEAIELSDIRPTTKFDFIRTEFEGCALDLRDNFFHKCEFNSCEIAGVSSAQVRRNTFIRCDFSNAQIRGIAIQFPNLREDDNYYFEDSSPICTQAIDWKRVLNVVEVSDDDEPLAEAGS